MIERVVIALYDPTWPRQFEDERGRLAGVFAEVDAHIEHVGSTAVPGLAAKPIIDIMVGLAGLAQAEAQIGALLGAGYHYVPEYEDELPNRRYFRKPTLRPRTHHLHCVVVGSEFWVTHLAFRDYLRAHPSRALEYGRLKRELARVHGSDKRAYTEAKSSFIEAMLAEASKESRA